MAAVPPPRRLPPSADARFGAPTRRRGLLGGLAVGLLALAALLLPLAVAPVVAWHFLGSPIPASLPSLAALHHRLLSPDDGTIVLDAVRILFWLGWLVFAGCALCDAAAQVRRRPTVRLPGLGWMQAATGPLIAAVALLVTAAPGIAMATEPSGVEMASHAVTASATAAPAPATAAPAAHTASAVPLYTVQAEDSLWTIAGRHLPATSSSPDPHLRWEEIFHLNRMGLLHPDGRPFTDPDLISPGWQLRMPADAVDVPTPPSTAPPDTPSAPSAAAPNSAPSDAHSPVAPQVTTSPSAGQGLAGRGPTALPTAPWIPPTATSTPATPDAAQGFPHSASTATPSPAAGQSDDSHQPAPPPAASASPTDVAASPQAVPPAQPDQPSPSRLPLELLGAGLGAAGLIWLLRRLRLRRQLTAGVGDLPPLPSPQAAAVEAAATGGADLDGAQFLHLALLVIAAAAEREGADLPDLQFAHFGAAGLELTFAAPPAMSPPSSYQALDPCRWWIYRDTDRGALDPNGTLAESAIAPYPCLTLLGYTTATDPADSEDNPTIPDRVAVLVDLEQVRSATFLGADQQTAAALRYAALGLRTSGWATYLDLTLAGFADNSFLGGDADQIQLVEELDAPLAALEAQVATQQARLDRGGLPILTTRLRGAGPAPQLLLLAATPADADIATRLGALATPGPRVGVGILTTAPLPRPGLIITVDDDGLLHVAGAPSPLAGALSEDTAAAVGDAIRTAAAPPDVPAADTTPARFPDPADYPAPAVRFDNPDATGNPAAASTPTPPHPAPPSPPPPTAALPPVLIRIMGSPSIDGHGRAPASRSHLRTATEILAFLALHEGAVDRQDLIDALWPAGRLDAAGRPLPQPAHRTLFAHISRARALAGTDPAGDPYLADVDPGDPLRLAGAVLTDYQMFCRLRDAAWDRAGDTAIAGLQAALDLVRGPLPKPDTTRPSGQGGWLWMSTTAAYHHMPPAVVEVAVRLAEAYLHAGDAARARDAVVKLLAFNEPEFVFDERLWQLRLLADFRLGGDEAAWATVGLLEAMLRERARYMDDEEYGQMSPELDRFIADLLNARPATASAS
jgi:hypothetical protein